MASTIKVDKIEGSTGSTITVPAGQTFTITDGMAVAGGGTGLTSFTAGDVLYATGSTTLAKLAKGTAEQVLAMNSGATAPDWGSVDLTVLPTITVAKGGTGQAGGFTQGDFLYATGATTLAKLAKGAATEVIAMNSGATAPEWVTAGGGTTIKRHYFDYNTRTAGDSTVNAQFTITSSFTPIDPTAGNNDLWVEWWTPVSGQNQDWGNIGLELKQDGTPPAYDFDGDSGANLFFKGNTQSARGGMFNIAAGTIPAGTYTIKLKTYYANVQPAFWNPNSTDDAKCSVQTKTAVILTEYKN